MNHKRYTIGLALIVMLLTGCSSVEPEGTSPVGNPDPGWDIYRINISFKYPSGFDLLEQLAYYKSDPTNPKYLGEIDPEKYTLQVVSSVMFPEEYHYFTLAKFDDLHSWVRTDKNGVYLNKGTWYFSNDFVIKTKNDGSPYSPLRYRISSSVLFGGVHDVTTWWEEGTVDKATGQHFPKCVKATFNGKEVKVSQGISYNEKAEPYYVGYFVDIIIDGHVFY